MEREAINKAIKQLRLINEFEGAIKHLVGITDEEVTNFTVSFRTNKKDESGKAILQRVCINGNDMAVMFKHDLYIWLNNGLEQLNTELDEL